MAPKAVRITASTISPTAYRYNATGTQIKLAPTAGISDSTAITTPQSTAAGIPRNQKIRPPRAP